jgi:hypothetical protein
VGKFTVFLPVAASHGAARRYLFQVIRPFLLGLSLALVPSVCRAADDEQLKHFLSLLGSIRMGSSYEDVKKLVPEMGELHPESEGDRDNTEANVKTMIDGIPLQAEFNFGQGRMVSHGFSSPESVPHEKAYQLMLKCIPILESLYGPSKRDISLPNDPEGDCPANPRMYLEFHWVKNGNTFGFSLTDNGRDTTVGWGGQGASPSELKQVEEEAKVKAGNPHE